MFCSLQLTKIPTGVFFVGCKGVSHNTGCKTVIKSIEKKASSFGLQCHVSPVMLFFTSSLRRGKGGRTNACFTLK